MFGWAEILSAIAITAFQYLPSLLVGTICIVLAIVRRQRHPRASGFAIAGGICLLLNVLLGFGRQLTIYALAASSSATSVASVLTIFQLIHLPVYLAALGCLTTAIFIDRDRGAADH